MSSSKRKAVIKAVGVALGPADADADADVVAANQSAGGLATVDSNMRTPVEERARRRRQNGMVRRRGEQEEARGQSKQEKVRGQSKEEEARRQSKEEEARRQSKEEEARGQSKEEEARRQSKEEEARRQSKEEEARGQSKQEKVRGQSKEEEARRQSKEEEARRQSKEEEARRQRERQLFRGNNRSNKISLVVFGLVVCILVVGLLFRYNRNNMSLDPVQEKSVNPLSPTEDKHVTKHCDQSELTGREQKKNSQQPKQTECDQGDEERDDEDKEGDQEEEESYSEAEDDESYRPTDESDSDGEESKQTGRRKREKYCPNKGFKIWKTNQPGTQTPPATIRIGLLNVHSMKKKKFRISELITRNNLSVFLTTETWLTNDTADRVLREASPEGFTFHYQVRANGSARGGGGGGERGGGVANQFSERFTQGEQIHFNHLNITTFEFVVTVLQHDDWDQPVVIINLYHPPRYNQQRFRRFLNEFQSLLDEVKKNYSSFIVAGDFNIPAKKGKRSYTDEFYHVWQHYDLTQHVDEPTHEGGNTLDLVFSSNVEISDLSVHNDGISDHYTVYFNSKPKDTREKTKENENEEQNRFRQTEE